MSCGIPWCMNCVGFHPNQFPTKIEMIRRMFSPHVSIFQQFKSYEENKAFYKNKLCSLCGRAYKLDGELDQTWQLTAKFVKLEFEHAGVQGVSDENIVRVVANCRRAVQELFKNIPKLQSLLNKKNIMLDQLEIFDRLTFSGRLSTIIEHAMQGRRVKLTGEDTRLR